MLEQVLRNEEYEDHHDLPYLLVQHAVMDAMGGTQRQTQGIGTRTSEVYDFCRLKRGKILPFKGEQTMAQPFAYTNIDFYPGTKTPIKGGLTLLRGNVTHYKNELSNRIEVAPADPGAWHMHSECTDDWAVQMISEAPDERGFWQVIKNRANHAWDCNVYNLIAADVKGIKFWPRPEKPPQED